MIKKPNDAAYYDMVKIVFENDYNISLSDAAKHVSDNQGYEYPNESSLRSKKSRGKWKKRNTAKSIKSATNKKADAIFLINKKNIVDSVAAKVQQIATKKGSIGGGRADSVATKPPKKGDFVAKNKANNLVVTETKRADKTPPIHDNETIDLRAEVLTRHREGLSKLKGNLDTNIELMQKATTKIYDIMDLVFDNPLLSDPTASPDDLKAIQDLLFKNPILVAANIVMKTSKAAIYAGVEAIRGAELIQKSERIAWGLDEYNPSGDSDDRENDEEMDRVYEELEERAMLERQAMIDRSHAIIAEAKKLERNPSSESDILEDD